MRRGNSGGRARRPFKIGLLAIVAAMFTGCSGSSGGWNGYVGRVVTVMEWKLPPDMLTAMTTTYANELRRAGVTVLSDRLRMPDHGIGGLFVTLGSEGLLTDEDGYFALDQLPPGITEGRIFKRRDPNAPFVAFPVSDLAFRAEPVPIRMTFVYAGPVGMNMADQLDALGIPHDHAFRHASRKNGVTHCVTDNSRACCEDQDGTFNDGLWYTDGYSAGRIKNFIGST